MSDGDDGDITRKNGIAILELVVVVVVVVLPGLHHNMYMVTSSDNNCCSLLLFLFLAIPKLVNLPCEYCAPGCIAQFVQSC